MSTTLTRVLIVDGHEDIAEWLADELILVGYQARAAFDGETALELTRCFRPDVMIKLSG